MTHRSCPNTKEKLDNHIQYIHSLSHMHDYLLKMGESDGKTANSKIFILFV